LSIAREVDLDITISCLGFPLAFLSDMKLVGVIFLAGEHALRAHRVSQQSSRLEQRAVTREQASFARATTLGVVVSCSAAIRESPTGKADALAGVFLLAQSRAKLASNHHFSKKLPNPSSTIYWCNIDPIYSQCSANENILGIYWTNIAPMNCVTREVSAEVHYKIIFY